MEKPLITILHENGSLDKLYSILPFLGFRVHTCASLTAFMSSPEELSSEAVILDRRSAEAFIESTGSSEFPSGSKSRPVIVISEEGGEISHSDAKNYAELPNDLLILFRFLQDNLPVFRREHLRLKLSLPGIYCHREGCHVVEIMSLGTGGAFIKTGWHQLVKDDPVRIGIPLVGMNKELEVEGRVVYCIEPDEANNYLQGVGVRFDRPETETVRKVEDYIRFFLQEELFESRYAGFEIPSIARVPLASPPLVT